MPPHATLDGLLRAQALAEPFVIAAIQAARSVFNPRQLHSDRPYRLVRSLDGMLREFEYQIDADRFLRIVAPDRTNPTQLAAQVVPYEKQVEVVAIRGQIDSAHPSVIAAIAETGETIQLAMSVADIFSGEIDFDSDLQPGDTSTFSSRKPATTVSSLAMAQSWVRDSSPMAAISAPFDGSIHQAVRPPSTTITDDR